MTSAESACRPGATCPSSWFRDDLRAAQEARTKGQFKFDEWVFITTFPFKAPAQRSWLDEQTTKAQLLKVVTWGDEDFCSHLARHADLASLLGLGARQEGSVTAGIVAHGGAGGGHGIYIEGGVSIKNTPGDCAPDPVLVRGKQVFAEAVSLLRVTAGAIFTASDGASLALPGSLWYQQKA